MSASGCKSVFVYSYISKHICFLYCNIQVEEAGALLVLIMEGMGAPMEGGSRDPYYTSQSYRLRFPVTCRMFAHRSGYNGFGAEGTGGPGSGVDVEQATIYEVTIR